MPRLDFLASAWTSWDDPFPEPITLVRIGYNNLTLFPSRSLVPQGVQSTHPLI